MPIYMHSSNHSQLASFSRKTLSAAVLSAVLCSGAYAAGLGKLTVLSSLGQPLRAEIELTSVAKDEAGTIVAKLASSEAYRLANVEMSPALFALRFAVENRGDRHFIRVTSNQPINEPFIALLIELGGTSNRLVREYTFLLDPADLRMGQSTQIAAAPGAAGRNAAQSQAATAQAAPVPQPEAQQKSIPQQRQAAQTSRPQRAARSEPAQEPAASGETYQVKSGDTLAQIAGQVKPEGVSLDQMLVAMYRANSSAFAGNNMNRLRAGQILSVPNAEAAKSISKSEAHGVIVAQAADFNAYRNKLAGQVAASAQPKASETSQSAGGKITTQVEEKPTAASESKDKLKLSKAGAAGKTGGAASGIAAGTEEQIAKEKALAEANARVKELEKNVGDLQKILEIKNKDLAAQQKQLDAKAAAAAAPAAAPAAKEQPVKEPAAKEPVAAAPAPVAQAAGNVQANAANGDAAKAPAAGAESAAQKPAEPAAAEKPAEAPVAAKPAPAKPKAKPIAPPPPPPEASFLDDLLGNTVVLSALGAGLLAGLGALGFYRMRRKKQDKQQYDDSMLADSSLKANSLFGSTGGQSVDTSNSVFNSSFQPAASQLDANEVDPVAEADVYIAYGRDAQAEEILKEALRTQPERHAVRLKLLEIYSSRKDLRAFETVATELYSMTKGEGEEWPQAAEMGAAIDPNNPLYAGAKPAEGQAGIASQSSVAETMDAELDDLLSTTDPHQSTFGALDSLGANSAYFATTMANDLPIESALEVPEAPAVEERKEPEAEAQSANVLDFDLAGFNIQPPAEPVQEDPAVSPADLDIGSLDFSLEQAPPAVAEDTDSPRTAMSVEVGSDDLSFLSAEVPSLEEEPAPQASAPADASLNFDLSDISLDLNSGESKAEAEPIITGLDDLAAPTLDFSTTDTKLDITQSAPNFEQSHDFNIDLPQDNFESNLITDAEEESSPDSEMATKLDLAIAYQEIGDREGARELLDEVIKGGNADQSEKAKSLLEALA